MKNNDSVNSGNVNRHPNVGYYLLAILVLVIMFGGIWLGHPFVINGIRQMPDYVNLSWAHDSSLIETLLSMLGVVWLVGSLLFWGGWLLRRSYRKIKGLHWRIRVGGKGGVAHFFPPVLSYLKLSCYYLIIVLLFVILQYPLQFIIFS
ncbi:MAG: hypothetical protein OEM38_02320 [Gammaproteobacteria bacterium]|nr:hypothetical protein [Gammaproteobacteria bacterium]